METAQLIKTAKELVAPNKGILAADESSGTIKRRFDSINVESTESNRRDYREMLFRAPGSSNYISGVILYEETLQQKSSDGSPMVNILVDQGIIPGIKVDTGAKPLAGAPDETITEGLDGLRDRLQNYQNLGARFAKWRATISIGESLPSDYCIDVNAHALARYAALCQEVGLVPIVEPEVLMDGTHTIDECKEATKRTLIKVYETLKSQRVLLEATLLKPNMVLSGKDAIQRAEPDEVAEYTVDCFMNNVPADVHGIVFLSGGQGDLESVENLNAINVLAKNKSAPWELSYSYGRGLQAAPLKAWSGDPNNLQVAQETYLKRCQETSDARQGKFKPIY